MHSTPFVTTTVANTRWLCPIGDSQGFLPQTSTRQDKELSLVSSGGLAVEHPALGDNGHRFEPRKRLKLFQGLISRLTTSWVLTTLNSAALSTELLKIKWGVKNPVRT